MNKRNAAPEKMSGPRNADPREFIERIYRDWDTALSRGDMKGLLALYAPDAVLESPLVLHLMNKETGICRGRDELRSLLGILRERKPPVRQYYRTGYFTDGKKLIWEYPRATPKGEQMDFVEVMEINDEGLIQHHRVYWGWFGVRVLQRDEYRSKERSPDGGLHQSGRASKSR